MNVIAEKIQKDISFKIKPEEIKAMLNGTTISFDYNFDKHNSIKINLTAGN